MARVVWAETALRDLEAIAEYIALHDPAAASRLVAGAFAKTDQLAHFPESGSRPRELKGTPYRRVIAKPMLLYYRIDGDLIYIVHVTKGERKFSLTRIEQNER